MHESRKEAKMETRKEIEACRVKGQIKKTAAERYADHQNDIGALMDCIQQELEVHASQAAKEPKNWGYPGDLAHVRGSLKQILAGFLISRYDWAEAAYAYTDKHLGPREEIGNKGGGLSNRLRAALAKEYAT